MSTEERVQAAIPGASVFPTKHGWQVGGFSMPPVEAQRVLRDAGLTVKDVWGAIVVTEDSNG